MQKRTRWKNTAETRKSTVDQSCQHSSDAFANRAGPASSRLSLSRRVASRVARTLIAPTQIASALLAVHMVTAIGCHRIGVRFPASSMPVSPAAPPAVDGESTTWPQQEPANLPAAQADSSGVVPVSYTQPSSPSDCAPCGPAGIAVGEVPCGGGTAYSGGNLPSAPRNAQEYIFDGGDQQPAVVVKKDWSTAGVDSTDTVIYYETLGGQVCVQPANRVAIYAPRFGAVRQVTGAVLSARAVGTERILVPVKPGRFEETDLAGTVMQPLKTHGEEQVSLIDAFQENNQGVPIAQVLPPQRMSDAIVPFENLDFFQTGQIKDEEVAVLGRILAGARTWYTPESLDIIIDGQEAAITRDTARAEEIYVYEIPDKCSMRICKAASHTIANSGDIVSFTIRFDNVGVKPLGNAVILDSLSPRLSYIEGSQQCSVDARFSSEPNEVGSVVLRWEIESAIQSDEGGVISFDCRVR